MLSFTSSQHGLPMKDRAVGLQILLRVALFITSSTMAMSAISAEVLPLPTGAEAVNARLQIAELSLPPHAAGEEVAAWRRLGEDPGLSAALRHACLQRAAQVAVKQGRLGEALAIGDRIAAIFATDGLEWPEEHLFLCERAATEVTVAGPLADAWLDLVWRHWAVDDQRRAAGALARGRALARTASEPLRLMRADAMHRLGRALPELWSVAQAANDRLASGGEDPRDRMIAGRHACLVTGEWERGLRLLAAGDTEEVHILALREQKLPCRPEDMARLADDWWAWAAAEPQTSPWRGLLQARAARWFRRAAPWLDAVRRTAGEQRLIGAPAALALDGPAVRDFGLLAELHLRAAATTEDHRPCGSVRIDTGGGRGEGGQVLPGGGLAHLSGSYSRSASAPLCDALLYSPVGGNSSAIGAPAGYEIIGHFDVRKGYDAEGKLCTWNMTLAVSCDPRHGGPLADALLVTEAEADALDLAGDGWLSRGRAGDTTLWIRRR